MKSKNTIIMFIIAALATIVAICSFIFVMRIIKKTNENTSVTLVELQEKMKDKENATIFAKKIAEIQALQDSINGHFLDPNKIDKFASYLEEMGASVGVEVLIKNIEVPPKTKNTMLLKLSISGEFQGVMKMIALLENNPYQINITQAYLNKNIEQLTEEEIKLNKVLAKTIWEANVTFNILSAN
jgi:hypothetical protein